MKSVLTSISCRGLSDPVDGPDAKDDAAAVDDDVDDRKAEAFDVDADVVDEQKAEENA